MKGENRTGRGSLFSSCEAAARASLWKNFLQQRGERAKEDRGSFSMDERVERFEALADDVGTRRDFFAWERFPSGELEGRASQK